MALSNTVAGAAADTAAGTAAATATGGGLAPLAVSPGQTENLPAFLRVGWPCCLLPDRIRDLVQRKVAVTIHTLVENGRCKTGRWPTISF